MALFGDLVAAAAGRELIGLRAQVHQSLVPLLLHLKDRCPAVVTVSARCRAFPLAGLRVCRWRQGAALLSGSSLALGQQVWPPALASVTEVRPVRVHAHAHTCVRALTHVHACRRALCVGRTRPVPVSAVSAAPATWRGLGLLAELDATVRLSHVPAVPRAEANETQRGRREASSGSFQNEWETCLGSSREPGTEAAAGAAPEAEGGLRVQRGRTASGPRPT